MKCERCKKETQTFTMSRFNTQDICPECETREKNHPLYAMAKKAEEQAVKDGDTNFRGVGLPGDLC